MNIAIIGSRTFNNFLYAKKHILKIINDNKITVTKIISGGANGADKVAETFANKFNIPIKIIKADWSKGKHAGVIRNTEIIKCCDIVIAFWDGQSKGTLDSINKAKRFNKKLFIVNILPKNINEGIRLKDDKYYFDFNKDLKTDILKLTYNKDYITKKQTRGLISYYSFKLNKNVSKYQRIKLLNYLKKDLKGKNQYKQLLNKSVIGLFNNPNIDIDLILIPESSSDLNFDLANKIKSKLPNTLFVKDSILKNELENVTLDYDLLKQNNVAPKTIIGLERQIKNAHENNVFKIKKINPQYKRYVINFLKLDVKHKQLLNKLNNGKILVVDEFINEGSTLRDSKRLIDSYNTREIILFTLIA